MRVAPREPDEIVRGNPQAETDLQHTLGPVKQSAIRIMPPYDGTMNMTTFRPYYCDGGKPMAIVQVSISMSVDGFIAGPNLERFPGLGEGGEVLHAWLGESGGRKVSKKVFADSGAVVTSRAIYDGTNGWGAHPPFHMPVIVVTHRPHERVVKGDTTFTFATGGIENAIAQASAAADGKMVHVMGGATIIQQVLNAGLADELQLHIAPIVLGDGTPLFKNITKPIQLERIEIIQTALATHLRFRVLKSPVAPETPRNPGGLKGNRRDSLGRGN